MKTWISTFTSGLLFLTCLSCFGAEVAPVMDSKSCDPPKYPKAALMNEEQGTVALAFLVSPDGKVTESKIDKSSGSKSLDKAALNAFSQCCWIMAKNAICSDARFLQSVFVAILETPLYSQYLAQIASHV